MTMRSIRAVAVLGALMLGVLPSAVADAAGCTVCICSVSATSMNFGTYNPAASGATTASATINASCVSVTLTMNATVELGLSAGTSGNAAARQMANGATRLNYNIYQDAAYATVWGNGSNGGSQQTMQIVNLLSFNSTKTAYGRIPAGQYVRTGPYTDSVVVTFTF